MTLNRLLKYTYHRRVWFSLCNSEQPFFCKVKLENLRVQLKEGSQHADVWPFK